MPSGASPWAARKAAVLNEPLRRLPEIPTTFMQRSQRFRDLCGTLRAPWKPPPSLGAKRDGNVFVNHLGYLLGNVPARIDPDERRPETARRGCAEGSRRERAGRGRRRRAVAGGQGHARKRSGPRGQGRG